MPDSRLLSTVSLRGEIDVVVCRQAAKQVAQWLGLGKLEQIRVATAVSEVARNVHRHARQGVFQFRLQADERSRLIALVIEARDKGPGIAQLQRILDNGAAAEPDSSGGLHGAQRLMDEFAICSSPKGMLVRLVKRIQPPRPMPGEDRLKELRRRLRQEGVDPFREIQIQGEELLLTTAELVSKQQELEATNLELESTNKGVVALYSELEKTAQELKDASASKSRFFSSMTHEFRTPINIIENISRLLLDGVDGQLNEEQTRQVRFISDAAMELSQLVNELLDLAQVQSGRMEIAPSRFQLSAFMQQLERFALALARRYPKVDWQMHPPVRDVALHTDSNRLLQILRNLISNAFKYTPQGRVDVRVFLPDEERIEFLVEDTGIGISEENRSRVFEEFARIRTPGLTHIEGTGLGLSLALKLAQLLKGDIQLESTPGQGSRFFVQLPRELEQGSRGQPISLRDATLLVIDDNEADRYLIGKLLAPLQPVLIEAATARDSIDRLHAVRPDVVLLDLDLPDISGEDLLDSMDWSLHRRVIINTARRLSDADRARLEPLCHAILDKNQPDYGESLVQLVERLYRSHSHES